MQEGASSCGNGNSETLMALDLLSAQPYNDTGANPQIVLAVVETVGDFGHEVLSLGRTETCLDTLKSMPPPAVIAKLFSVPVDWAMPSVVRTPPKRV
jgi:hypothetical protein